MITAKALYASARLRSLLLSVSGVILGSGVAYGAGAFRADIFVLALLTTLPFQVPSDYANDYGDAVKGTDDDGRLGPRRAIQTGRMSAAEMKCVIVATALLSALCSFALSVLAFGEVLSRDAIFGAGRHSDIRGDPLCRRSRRIRIPGAWRRFRVFVFWTFERAGLILFIRAFARCGAIATCVRVRDVKHGGAKFK